MWESFAKKLYYIDLYSLISFFANPRYSSLYQLYIIVVLRNPEIILPDSALGYFSTSLTSCQKVSCWCPTQLYLCLATASSSLMNFLVQHIVIFFETLRSPVAGSAEPVEGAQQYHIHQIIHPG